MLLHLPFFYKLLFKGVINVNDILSKLISALPDSVDGALIVSEENRKYFTGFDSTDGILLATKNGSTFLTDSRYIEAAQNVITCCEVEEFKSLKKQLPAILEKYTCNSLCIEADRITVAQLGKFSDALPDIVIRSGNELDGIINAIRCVKNDREVESILRAQEIAENAFEHILNYIKVGITERELALELDFAMLSRGAEDISFKTIAVSGVNSSMPHGVPSYKKLENGDFITLDFGAVYEGYHSDMTRTVALGFVSDKQREIYNTVLIAQLAALSVLAPGIPCSEADRAARDIIADAGCKDFFGHGTGHGVGIEIHEHPTLSPGSNETLAVGNIVTVEPGIYLPGEFGVRIEDMALITADGCRNLTNCDKKLLIL